MIRLNFQQGLNGAVRPVPVWAAWLGAVASIAVGIVLFLVAASLALIVIPLAAIAGAIALWRFKSRLKAELKARAPIPTIPLRSGRSRRAHRSDRRGIPHRRARRAAPPLRLSPKPPSSRMPATAGSPAPASSRA